ncbi:cadherin domain-containing protein [Rhodopirellula sp. MGV]|uniref:cadherin domain-containing protein n=1 Tax=Rhodopirellula sp. MGV TaxID=2023130 RepID=UPI000B976713|nr:cadherin domain-containing protein [Rhodopirellula sp. MGV]OYP39074.1 cellulosome anchor protein [Rhodopirellula sp. MGV]PNY35549.1 cellulosome anchor protein [Rhodopirellula baltica]
MRQVTKALLSLVPSRRSDSNRNRPAKRKGRKARLETLESRRVLAATIASFTPTASGFVAELSEEIDSTKINLYDSENGLAGDADVTLNGASGGNVQGSLIIDGTTLTFVATGGALPADTYTATLRSASDGFTDLADGELLDGDDNSTAGGNFVDTFTVTSSGTLTVGIPDIVRGPTQAVQVPVGGDGTTLPPGLPIQLSDADGVTSVTLTIQYDPDLLDISDVQLGSDAPTGSQVQANLDTPGTAIISFFSVGPMSAGEADIVDIIASVPEDATYGAMQAIQITQLEVNAGAITADSDDAIHVVAFPGDANRNQRYDAEDARLIARVGVDLDSGFVSSNPTSTTASTMLYPTVDPMLIGDVSGNGELSPLDSSDILRQVVGLSTPNIPDLPDAQAPTGLSLSATSLNDNITTGTTVGTFATTDPDSGDTHTYTLVSGTGSTDNSSFTISGNTLVSATTFDASVKDTLSIRVKSTDSTGRSIEKTFTITVQHNNSAPTAIAIDSMTVAENSATGTSVGTLSTTDPDSGDTHTYSIVSIDGSTSSTVFTINGDELQVGSALDFETKSSYSVVIRSTDSADQSTTQTFTITVTDVNEAPTAMAITNSTVGDNAVSGTTVGTLSSTDVDAGETFTYTLVSGSGDTDNASFAINGDELVTAATIDFSSQTSYSVRVRTTDSGGNVFEQVFTITQGNSAPSAIALSSDTIAENNNTSATVGTLSTTDSNSGDTHTYTLVSGDGDDDNASFTISGNTLVTTEAFDFETQDTYTIRVRSTDSTSLFVEEILTITVTNVNEAATTITLDHSSVADGESSGTTVGAFSSDDPDSGDTLTYTLVSGTGDDDNASFTISGGQLVTGFTADQATKATYSVRVQVEDAGGLTTEETFTVTITEQNVAPTAIALSSATVAEDAEVDDVIGTLSTTDANSTDVFTYTLVSGTGDTDNASFSISGDTLTLNTTLDFETKSSYSVRVRSTDPFGLFFEDTFTISVTDVNEDPSALVIDNATVTDGATSGTTVGGLSVTDPDSGDTVTYTLVTGDGDDDNASFTISGSDLVTGFTADFFQKSSYTVRIRATDSGGLFTEEAITITVNEANVAPTAIALSASTVAENTASGTAVGTLSSTDANSGDTHTYTLVSGAGDDDNASFTISGDELQLAITPDFETQETYTIRVRSTDSGGLTFDETFTITVTNVNEAATTLTIGSDHVADGETSGTVIGMFANDDPDQSDTFTYTLISGTGDDDNASFTISGDELVTAFTADQATKSSYSILVQVSDAGGLTTDQTFTITVTEANTAPTAIALSQSSIAEDQPSGSAVGMLSATDANSNDTHTFELVSGTGDDDNASFTIVDGELQTAIDLDFETKSSYSVRVRATDNFGGTFEQDFSITVTDVNEAPSNLMLSFMSIADGEASGTDIGDFTADDPDAGDTLTYSLVSGTGDTDNSVFSVSGGTLTINEAVDDAIQSMYSIRVRAEDAGGLFTEEILMITVTEANVAPTAIALSASTVSIGDPAGTVVGDLSATDSNTTDDHTYVLVAGTGDTDNTMFTIEGDQLKTTAEVPSGAPASYSIRVEVTDHYGMTFEQVLTITVQ